MRKEGGVKHNRFLVTKCRGNIFDSIGIRVYKHNTGSLQEYQFSSWRFLDRAFPLFNFSPPNEINFFLYSPWQSVARELFHRLIILNKNEKENVKINRKEYNSTKLLFQIRFNPRSFQIPDKIRSPFFSISFHYLIPL